METVTKQAGGKPRIFIIGVGNAYRSDDAVGLWVARCLRSEIDDDVLIQEESGEGTALMEAWNGADAVILIDAAQSGGKLGTVYCFDVHEQAPPASPSHSSDGLS